MAKKIISILFLCALAAACVYGFLYIKHKNETESANIFEFVPANATAVIRFNDSKQLCKMLDDDANFWSSFFHKRMAIKSLIENNATAEDSLSLKKTKTTPIVSVVYITKNNINFIYIIPVKQQFKINFSASKSTISSDDENKITQYNSANGDFYVCNYKNFAAVGTDLSLIKDFNEQISQNKTLANDTSFNKIAATAGKYVEANVFFKSIYFPEIIKAATKEENTAFAESTKNLANWFSLDIANTIGQIHFSGFAFTADSNFLNISKSQQPTKLETLSIITPETDLALSLNISNIDAFFANYKTVCGDTTNNNLFSANDSVTFGAKDFIKSIYPEEISLTFDATKGWTTIIKTADGDNAAQEIEKIGNENFISIIEPIFGRIFGLNTNKNISIVENYVFIAKDKIEKLPAIGITSINSDYIIDESTSAFYVSPKGISILFSKDETNLNNIFRNIFIQVLPAQNKYYINANVVFKQTAENLNIDDEIIENQQQTDTIVDTITNKIKAEIKDSIVENKEKLNEIAKKETALEQQKDDKKTAKQPQKEQTIFKQIIKLESGNCTLIQTDNKKISLIGANKKTLWSNDLNEKIDSRITIIEPLNQGAQYLLFNTENRIYLIDTKGNNANGFPIILQTSVTNQVTAFAYDSKNDYRFFIACANKKIYLYNLDGKQIQDWRTPRTDGIVTRPLQFFRTGGKDYLVATDNNKIYIFNRRGNVRTDVKEKIQIPDKNNFELTGTSIKTTDKAGKTVIINLNTGKTEKK